MANPRRVQLMKKMASARASGLGNNFRDGKYRLAVKKQSLQDGFKGTHFLSTMVVVQSVKIPVVEIKTGKVLDITPNPVGSDVDFMQTSLEKEEEGGMSRVKFYMESLLGIQMSDDDYFDTLADFCDVEENGDPRVPALNPGRGLLIDMETVRQETKKKKVEIVGCKWSHVDPKSYDQNAIGKWIDDIAEHMLLAQQQALAKGQAPATAALPAGEQQTQAA